MLLIGSPLDLSKFAVNGFGCVLLKLLDDMFDWFSDDCMDGINDGCIPIFPDMLFTLFCGCCCC